MCWTAYPRFLMQQPTSGGTVSTDPRISRELGNASGDVHQNPDPATKYPCFVCTSNITSRGVSYMGNHCSGWVHSKSSGLQNAVEYRRIKNCVCSSCSFPPTPTPHRFHTKYNNSFQWGFLHHSTIQCKWRRQQIG